METLQSVFPAVPTPALQRVVRSASVSTCILQYVS